MAYRLVLPLVIIMPRLKGGQTGIYFIDYTQLSICHNKPASNNRVLAKIAKIAMSSYGWFMGFKLHLVINHKGGIMAIKITNWNSCDLSRADFITKGLPGQLFGDKGYISQDLLTQLYARNLRWFTGIGKDRLNHLLALEDKIILRKRSLIEAVFNLLKNSINLEHSRHIDWR